MPAKLFTHSTSNFSSHGTLNAVPEKSKPRPFQVSPTQFHLVVQLTSPFALIRIEVLVAS
jgi:hypothetical protein